MNPLIRPYLLLCALLLLFALGGCASPSAEQPRDRDFLTAMSTGQRFFALRQYDLAAKSYRAAWRRAALLDEPRDIAEGAYNLAAALAAAGRREEARGFLREARAEYERAGMPGAGEAWLLEARLAQADGRRADALALADCSLASRGMERDDGLRAQALQFKAALFCEAGDTNAAENALVAAGAAARKLSSETAVHGHIAATRGALARRAGRTAEAAAQYDRAAEIFKAAARGREMADACGEAAACYEISGQAATAAGRHYQAARAWAGQGDLTNALKQVQAALRMADKASDKELSARTQFLFEQIKKCVEEGNARLSATQEGT